MESWMAKHFYGTGVKKPEDAEHIGGFIARSLQEVIAMSGEMEKQLALLKSCPKPCGDGMVEIAAPSGQTRKMPCPLINSSCRYGEWLEQGLDRYVAGVMSGIGVPRRHLDNFTKALYTKASAGIDKWQARGFLIFTGDTGSGKSFGAALAVREYLKNLVPNHFDRGTWQAAEKAEKTEKTEKAGISVVWCAAADISDDRETVIRAKRGQLTVIDDLGGEPDTPAIQAALRGVILKRHDMKLPTVITTTLTLQDIDARYGGRVVDRLTEDIGKGGRIVECGNMPIDRGELA